MKKILLKLIEQKEVSQDEAEKYSLFDPQDISMTQQLAKHGLIKIPVWVMPLLITRTLY